MIKTLMTVYLSVLSLIIMQAAYATTTMNAGNFKNGGTFEALDDLIINARNEFENSGLIKAPSITLNAPSITSPTDPKLGRICWENSFTLNGMSVSKEYAKCI